jgi:peroxiredoxin
MATQAPAEIIETFANEQAGLDAAGVPAGVAKVGTRLPDAELLDVHGNPATLQTPAVVVFYRGAWCPYCNIALRTYEQELVPELARRRIALVAISPQKPDGSLTMREKNELSFTVLSDPGNQLAGKLGILTAATEDARSAQAKLGVHVDEANADGTYAIPMPTVAVVDAGGTIRWIDVHPNYTSRSEPADILAAVDAHLPLG